jgi:TPR repeat protein
MTKRGKSRAAEIAETLWVEGCNKEDANDFEGARRCYEIAAHLNHDSAQNNLANILDDKIQPKEPELAIYWYKRAVKNGNYSAPWNLHRHYDIIGNRRWSDYWLQIAAKMGHEDALELLATKAKSTAPRR